MWEDQRRTHCLFGPRAKFVKINVLIFSSSSFATGVLAGCESGYLEGCQETGVIGSALGLVGPVSVYCDWVRWKIWSATSISVWHHVQLSKQIRPWDTLACFWDVKQASNPSVWKEKRCGKSPAGVHLCCPGRVSSFSPEVDALFVILSYAFPVISLGFTIFGEMFA